MGETTYASERRSSVPGHRSTEQNRGLLGMLMMVGAWLVILASVAVLAVMVIVPRVAGATPYAVLTGSMSPAYPPGTLVVVRPVEPDSIGVGSVITYQLTSGRPEVVTHRVVEVQIGSDGPRFVTRGDANNTSDEDPVLPEQIRGELWYAVPYAGHLHNALDGRERQMLVQVAAGGLIAYACYQVAIAVLRRRRPS